MSGSLDHSPAEVVCNLLIGLGLGTDPTADEAWPIFTTQEPDGPDVPDSVITVYDTAGRQHGRSQVDGEVQEHRGVMIRVRDANHPDGHAKANEIAIALDETVYQDAVVVGAATYLVHAISRAGSINVLGKEPTSNRNLFTINALVSLKQTT